MPFFIGDRKIGDIWRGNLRISQIKFGAGQRTFYQYSSGPYTPVWPYLIFEFTQSDFIPTSGSSVTNTSRFGYWHRISTSPNRWYWEGFRVSSFNSGQYGWPMAFCNDQSYTGKLVPNNLGGGYCKIIGSGGFTSHYSSESFSNMDRTFSECTGLTEVSLLSTPNTLVHVGGAFQGCTSIEGGMLAQYNYWSTNNTNISNHSGTFTDAGLNTQTGAAELDQIPVGWGGNLVPASTLMVSGRVNWKGTYDSWQITGNAPTWSNVSNGLYLFTSASVSSYAGVSMNRSRISKFNNLGTTKGSSALYFYPCFMQRTTSAITWAVTTAQPNGSLGVNDGNTDMPGTLDYGTYGPFTNEYGTRTSGNTYFCFLVTNVPIASWNGLTDAYGVLYNSNFKTDGGFRWFF